MAITDPCNKQPKRRRGKLIVNYFTSGTEGKGKPEPWRFMAF
jgi:hypothetical protein